MFEKIECMIVESNIYMKELVIGGIVVGIGINVYFKFGEMVLEEIS